MGELDQALKKFIEEMGYLNNENILGIIFYGSALTGYSSKGSDVDLHIITANSTKLVRGVKEVNGFKMEYFEKPILDIYMSIENEYNNQNNAAESIFGMGKILFERNGVLSALHEYVNFKFSTPMPPLELDDAKEQACIIDTKINRLQKKCDKNEVDFYFYYSIVISKIIEFYHRRIGCPIIPIEKLIKIYTDQPYRISFCKDYIPEEEFINMVLDAIIYEGPKERMMEKAKNLYLCSIKKLEIDPNNYRIYIKSRNDPNNFRNKQ